MQQVSELIQMPLKQSVLHCNRNGLQLIQGMQRTLALFQVSIDLSGDDVCRQPGFAGITEQKVIFEFIQDCRSNPQRIDDSGIVVELNEIESPKNCGILILFTPANPQVATLNLIGQGRQIIVIPW